jgi:hypothetical protein
MVYQRIMALSGADRMDMCFSMSATARTLVWSSIPSDLPEAERRYMYVERMYGKEFCDTVRGKLG